MNDQTQSKGRILVLEDNDDVRLLTSTILRSAGYEVTEAASPLQVLDREVPPVEVDLIVSDVVMPGMSGPEFSVVWLKKHPQARFLFMSGFFDDSNMKSVLNADNLIRKPFKAADLLSRVEKMIASL